MFRRGLVRKHVQEDCAAVVVAVFDIVSVGKTAAETAVAMTLRYLHGRHIQLFLPVAQMKDLSSYRWPFHKHSEERAHPSRRCRLRRKTCDIEEETVPYNLTEDDLLIIVSVCSARNGILVHVTTQCSTSRCDTDSQ